MTENKTFKVCLLEFKSVDDKGLVKFYFAAWTRDRDGDTILKTAYDKTLIENKEYIYHNLEHDEVVGRPIEFGVDEKGAWCSSQLSLNTTLGLDTYNKYKDGLIKGHSQEFIVKASTPDGKGGRIISEMELWGVTSVTKIPANADALTISVKNKNLKEAGIVHCDNCKTILPKEIVDQEETTQSKCPNCGRFINSKTGKMTKTTNKSFLAMEHLEHKSKDEAKKIGKTDSGKPIMEEPFDEEHKEFSAVDHKDAALLHVGIAKKCFDKAMTLSDYSNDKAIQLHTGMKSVDAAQIHLEKSKEA